VAPSLITTHSIASALLTESEPAGITQKDNLIRKVIHIAAWNVPEKDIWMPFLGIPCKAW
jgi:hypothetical protein